MNRDEDAAGKSGAKPQAGGNDEPMLYCPVCDMRLVERGCKLRCPRCHYYMSCSDYV